VLSKTFAAHLPTIGGRLKYLCQLLCCLLLKEGHKGQCIRKQNPDAREKAGGISAQLIATAELH